MAVGQGVDAWMETCLVAITKVGGSDVAFQGLTESVDMDVGEKDIDVVALVNGGRISKWVPQDVITVTLEMYPVEVGTDTGTTGKGVFDLFSGSTDSSQPVILTNSRTRTAVRIAILWTDDTSQASATAAVTATKKAARMAFADGYVTSANPSFTDGVKKWTVTLKFAPFDKAGNANSQGASEDGTSVGGLTALASYTTSTKF